LNTIEQKYHELDTIRSVTVWDFNLHDNLHTLIWQKHFNAAKNLFGTNSKYTPLCYAPFLQLHQVHQPLSFAQFMQPNKSSFIVKPAISLPAEIVNWISTEITSTSVKNFTC